jgi:hypothetical protein
MMTALTSAECCLAQAFTPPSDFVGGSAEWVDCGCYDQPNKHYPYSIVVFKKAERELITRPERHEGALTFSPLAVRYGTRYCALDSEQECYGTFPHPCEFTDFRYGATLAEYFPTCKDDTDEKE